MNKKSTVILGSATIDKIVQKHRTLDKMGGVVTYAGLTFQLHGIDTAVVTNIAAADQALLELFRSVDITVVNGSTRTTTTFVNYTDGETREQECPIQADPIQGENAGPILDNAGHVHLGPLFPTDIAPATLEYLKEVDALISMDIQGYTRHIENRKVVPKVSGLASKALEVVNIIKADDREMELFLDTFRMDLVSLRRFFSLDEIVITEGRRGGYVIGPAGQRIDFFAKQVNRIFDTTGAGDVFFAAYLAGRYHMSKDIEGALDHATDIAAAFIEGDYIPHDMLKLD
jgi:sugar/nucleoside kinase (ribokinase family)